VLLVQTYFCSSLYPYHLQAQVHMDWKEQTVLLVQTYFSSSLYPYHIQAQVHMDWKERLGLIQTVSLVCPFVPN